MPGNQRTEAKGDTFSTELERQRPLLERSARRLCSNPHDAEDLVQATLERAWNAREQFIPGSNLAGWLYRILVNKRRDDLRRRHGFEIPLGDDDIAAAPPGDHDLAPTPEVVLALVGDLPPELRAPLELHALSGKR